jgi:hypothetical protein
MLWATSMPDLDRPLTKSRRLIEKPGQHRSDILESFRVIMFILIVQVLNAIMTITFDLCSTKTAGCGVSPESETT